MRRMGWTHIFYFLVTIREKLSHMSTFLVNAWNPALNSMLCQQSQVLYNRMGEIQYWKSWYILYWWWVIFQSHLGIFRPIWQQARQQVLLLTYLDTPSLFTRITCAAIIKIQLWLVLSSSLSYNWMLVGSGLIAVCLSNMMSEHIWGQEDYWNIPTHPLENGSD
jgi:hypothetical protein